MQQELNFYIGVVEDRMDPLRLGRVRVRIVGLHTENKSVLPTEDLPWAYKIQPTTSGAISGIGHSPVGVMEGTWVAIQFIDPDKQMPFVVGTVGGYPISTEIDIETELVGSTGAALPDFNPTDDPVPPPPVEASKRTAPPFSATVVCNKVDVKDLIAKYGDNVLTVGKALCAAGISDAFAIMAVLGNVGKECGFVPKREDTYYTSADRLRAIFPTKTKGKTDADLSKYVRNAEACANFIYAGVNGNGDEASGDGWKYRGGGYIQLTGKANYKAIGSRVGSDLETSPALVMNPSIAANVVAEYILSRFGSAPTFTTFEEACSQVTKKVNPGGVKNDLPKVITDAKLCYLVAQPDVLTSSDGTPVTDSSGAPVNSGGSGSGLVNTPAARDSNGFSDPNKKYPLKNYLNEPDTNRLARGSKISDTIVYQKEQKRRTGVPKANNLGKWDQPLIPYNAKYPFNNVWQSESGHFLEFDDTEGRERIHLYHKKGTFTEVDSNGTQVNFIVGDGYTIYERNGKVFVAGALDVTVRGATSLRLEGEVNIETHGSAIINVHRSATLNAAKDLNITAGGNINIKARGNFNVDASRIDLNSGNASSLPIITCMNSSSVELPDLIVLARGDEIAIDYEAFEGDNTSVRQAYVNKMVEEGIATQEEIDAPVEATEEITPTPNDVQPVIGACGIPDSQKEFTGKEILSKYYTLGDLTAGYSRKLVPQSGLTESQIYCNLKALATNVLDPLKARYPDIAINSCFRRPGDAAGASATSQHNKGQSVDISFPGLSRSELYDRIIEIQSIIPYDQLILEYASGPGWIHISFSTTQNRKQSFTMNHHKRVSKDLYTFAKIY